MTAGEAALAEWMLRVDLAEVRREYLGMTSPLGLIVGQCPGPNTRPDLPMFPWPEGSAGGRLLAMSGMPPAAYLARLRRANLCDGPYRAADARRRAEDLLSDQIFTHGRPPRARFVLCGRKVAEAFDLGDAGWFTRASLYGVDTVLIPHPSGRSREYNNPAVVARAREAVRWAARWEGE